MEKPRVSLYSLAGGGSSLANGGAEHWEWAYSMLSIIFQNARRTIKCGASTEETAGILAQTALYEGGEAGRTRTGRLSRTRRAAHSCVRKAVG